MGSIQLSPEFMQFMTEEEQRRQAPALPRDFIPPPPPKQEAPQSLPPRPSAGLSGSVPHKTRQPTPEELMAMAMALQASMGAEHDARMKAGPATYQAWKAHHAPKDSGEDYDFQGAFHAGDTPGPDGHWTDRNKLPNHETFSEESNYADFAPEKAGRWRGDDYVPAGQDKLPAPWLERYMAGDER